MPISPLSARPVGFRLLVGATAMVLALGACGGDDSDTSAAQGEAAETEDASGASTTETTAVETSETADGAESDQPTRSTTAVSVESLQVQTDRLDPVGTPIADVTQVVVPNTPGAISTVGRQRVMTALVGEGANQYRGGDDQPVNVYFESVQYGLWGEVEGTWLTTDHAELGLYVSYFDFPIADLWEVVVSAGDEEVGRTLIEVVDNSVVPNVGDDAPRSETPTAFDAEQMAAISTDHHADLSYYDLTVAEAVENGRPAVIVFATPAFCQTALCSPTLSTVQAATASRNDIDVVHVEPFDLELAPQGVFEPIPAMFEWGLYTEPWVFVVDADGVVSASFEGIIGDQELEAAIAQL